MKINTKAIKSTLTFTVILVLLIGSVKVLDWTYKAETDKLIPECQACAECDKCNDVIIIDNEPTEQDIINEIAIWSSMLNLDYDLMYRIAKCESGFNPFASNANSSAKGVYQFIDGTWNNTTSGKRGEHQFNWKANIKEASILVYNDGLSHWRADKNSENCWDI